MELLKSQILPYLQSHTLMQIATYSDEYPWIASVYYTHDSDLTLYFLSDPETLHCRHTVTNPRVAVAITDSEQEAPLKGLQLWGMVEQLGDESKVRYALGMWKKTLKISDVLFSYENMMNKVLKGRMYQVKPKRIKFFNQALFDVEDGKEPVLEL